MADVDRLTMWGMRISKNKKDDLLPDRPFYKKKY
jgi:hypothetical protein